MPESSLRWKANKKQALQNSNSFPPPQRRAHSKTCRLRATEAERGTLQNAFLFEAFPSTAGDANLSDVSFLLLLEQASRGFGIQIEPADFLEVSLIETMYIYV